MVYRAPLKCPSAWPPSCHLPFPRSHHSKSSSSNSLEFCSISSSSSSCCCFVFVSPLLRSCCPDDGGVDNEKGPLRVPAGVVFNPFPCPGSMLACGFSRKGPGLGGPAWLAKETRTGRRARAHHLSACPRAPGCGGSACWLPGDRGWRGRSAARGRRCVMDGGDTGRHGCGRAGSLSFLGPERCS